MKKITTHAKKLVSPYLLVISAGISVFGVVTVSSFAETKAGVTSISATDLAIKDALIKAKGQLGNLQEWQRKLFDAEVLPQFQRFIKDYRLAGGAQRGPAATNSNEKTINVEVDTVSLKHYLNFYAPNFFKIPNPQILVLLKYEPTCQPCLDSLAQMKNTIQMRLTNRGLAPVWVNASDFSASTTDRPEDQIVAFAREKKAVGGLIVEWAAVVADEVEAALAEEKRYVIHAFMQLGDIVMNPPEKEILDTDSFDVSTGRLLTDMFTEFGAKTELEQMSEAHNGKNEILLAVSGVQDYAQYLRIKASLTASLQDIISFEERRISKGRVVFAVYSQSANEKDGIENLKKQMGTFNLDPNGNSQALTVEIK